MQRPEVLVDARCDDAEPGFNQAGDRGVDQRILGTESA
jgi:hypothetical protein